MTSAYDEATAERQQKATTVPRDVAGQRLDTPETTLAEMEERSGSSRASLATTGDSSGDESCCCLAIISSVEVDVPPAGESPPLDKDEDEDEEGSLDRPADSTNETGENSRTNGCGNRGSLFHEDDNERCGEKRGSFSILATTNGRTSALSESAATCGPRKDQAKDHQAEDRRNPQQSVLVIRVQERRATCDGDARACRCENVTEPRPEDEARRDEEDAEREVGQEDRREDSFYDAVRSGNASRVSALIAGGCVPSCLDEPDWNVSGDPPLLVAATNHCLPVLSALLANGCDPAVRSPRGETALHRTILSGGPGNVLKFVEDLLKHGCPPNVKEAGGGSTALHVLSRQLAHAPLRSLRHNLDAAVKTLELLARAGPVNAKDHHGRSALHILASSTIFDNNQKTDIESLIGTLLAAGADTALKNDRGETPLHESLECGALNTATSLVPHTPTGITSRYGETPLHIASRKNYVEMVTKLLDHGEDPGTQDAGGNTPLHLASARGFHQSVSLLVTSPLAQLEKANVDGLTALQVAAESGFVNAVRILLKAGADPSQTINYCATILRRHPDISLLINHELTRRRQLAA